MWGHAYEKNPFFFLKLKSEPDTPDPVLFPNRRVVNRNKIVSSIVVDILEVRASETSRFGEVRTVVHLRDDHAVLAVNISNRFLDLRPLLFGIAERFDLEAALFDSRGSPPEPTRSCWVLLSKSRTFMADPRIREKQSAYQPERTVFWTDRYSNLFCLLR